MLSLQQTQCHSGRKKSARHLKQDSEFMEKTSTAYKTKKLEQDQLENWCNFITYGRKQRDTMSLQTLSELKRKSTHSIQEPQTIWKGKSLRFMILWFLFYFIQGSWMSKTLPEIDLSVQTIILSFTVTQRGRRNLRLSHLQMVVNLKQQLNQRKQHSQRQLLINCIQ